jgi:hypothetical protein
VDTISVGRRVTLHLGVIVQPYRSTSRKSTGLTTGDVAQFLESKYGLMQTFFNVKEKRIAGAFENSMAGAIESLVMGHKVDPFGRATQCMDQMFRDFINSKEAERVGIPGTPTQAALKGVNHRLKRPYAKSNPRRPSFRDTGLLVSSFKSWVD